MVAWLTSQGFRVNQTARSRNWVAFSGTAGQVAQSLRTPIHRFSIDGRIRFANTTDPSIPAALEPVIDGFLGLNDIPLESYARMANPQFNSGSSHYLAPEDFSTIYNLKPLYQAGFDGTGQNIVGGRPIQRPALRLRAFRTRYGLPANDPKLVPYSGTEPGFTGSQIEGNLDLEWAGAIAPKATHHIRLRHQRLYCLPRRGQFQPRPHRQHQLWRLRGRLPAFFLPVDRPAG